MLDPLSLFDEEFDRSGEFQASIGELPRATFWAFLGAALLGQVGLLAASLGLLLAGFRGQLILGGGLFVGGLFALGAAFGIYRWHRNRA